MNDPGRLRTGPPPSVGILCCGWHKHVGWIEVGCMPMHVGCLLEVDWIDVYWMTRLVVDDFVWHRRKASSLSQLLGYAGTMGLLTPVIGSHRSRLYY